MAQPISKNSARAPESKDRLVGSSGVLSADESQRGGDGCSTASGGMVENAITDRAYRDDLIAAFGPYAYRRTARDVGQTNLMLTTVEA